jgi:Flp pilus assembly pilin Flp
MLAALWKDNRGHISEYALILGLILVLGIGLISETGTALRNPYGRVSTHQATSGTGADKKK